MAEVGELPLISQIVFGASENMLARPFILPNAVWLFIILGIFFSDFQGVGGNKKGSFHCRYGDDENTYYG